MEVIGIICEYNPFHNGHIYHINQIKKRYPDSLIILVLNGYFLERGEISFLTKEDKVKIALNNDIDLVVELPVIFGSQAADIFAKGALTILNHLQVNRIIFGSECNDVKVLEEIALKELDSNFDEKVKDYLKNGVNYPTALARAINVDFDFNKPNDLLGISYIKTIKKENFKIDYAVIKRTSDYHDLESMEDIISASNVRKHFMSGDDITKFVPTLVQDKMLKPDYPNLFKLLKYKILTDDDLKQYLTVDEGIENRLIKEIKKVNNLEDLRQIIKTKRYTYNKINRMLIHILLGIKKEDMANFKLDYIRVLGFNKPGQIYLKKIKKEMNISLKVNIHSLQYQYELKAASVYDLINQTHTYDYELQNKPFNKDI